MKPKFIAAAVVLTAATLWWTAPSVFAGHGGHGGGGGGFSGGGRGGGGGHSFSGGYSRGYSGGGFHASGGNFHADSGGGLGRVYGSHYNFSPSSHGNQIYRSYSSVRTGVSHRQFASSANLSSHYFTQSNQGALNRTNHFANANQLRASHNNTALQRHNIGLVNKQSVVTHNASTHQGNWARNNSANKGRFDQRTQNTLRNWQGNKSNWAQARHNHSQWCHGHHSHDWWHHHCNTIIFVGSGWWGWWDGWWYPAWGYDPYYSYYEYDGPIYGYDGLPPDEAIAKVQSELQRLGYYSYALDGILGPSTQDALNRYQRDHGLPITGTVDPETIGSLGLS